MDVVGEQLMQVVRFAWPSFKRNASLNLGQDFPNHFNITHPPPKKNKKNPGHQIFQMITIDSSESFSHGKVYSDKVPLAIPCQMFAF